MSPAEMIRRGVRYVCDRYGRRFGAPTGYASAGQMPSARRAGDEQYVIHVYADGGEIDAAVRKALAERDRRLIRTLREGRR